MVTKEFSAEARYFFLFLVQKWTEKKQLDAELIKTAYSFLFLGPFLHQKKRKVSCLRQKFLSDHFFLATKDFFWPLILVIFFGFSECRFVFFVFPLDIFSGGLEALRFFVWPWRLECFFWPWGLEFSWGALGPWAFLGGFEAKGFLALRPWDYF